MAPPQQEKPIFYHVEGSGLFWVHRWPIQLVHMNTLFRVRRKSSFESCRDQLNTISSGMQDQIVTKGSLEGVNSVDDICHHIVSGFDSPEECAGMVKERVNAVCKEDTLTVDVLDEISYEIKAQPRVKSSRNICITEKSSFIREIAENAGIDFFEVDGKFLCEFGFDGCICVHGVDDFTSE